MKKEKIKCEESLSKCFKHCFKLLWTKIMKILESTPYKMVNFLLKVIFGGSIFLILSYVITSSIPIQIASVIDNPIDPFCLRTIQSYELKTFEYKKYYMSDRTCYNVDLGNYDKDYSNYKFDILEIGHTEYFVGFIDNRAVYKKEIIYAFSIIEIPQIEYNKISHRNQTIITTNSTQKIEIPDKDGFIKLGEFWSSDNQQMFRIYFTHSISLWELFLKSTRIIS